MTAQWWWLMIAPCVAVAQPQLGPTELSRAKSLLDLYKAELSAEQYASLSSKLAQTEQAYVELTAVTGETAAAAAETAAATEVVATGGRAVLSGIADVLPLLLFVYPATAHAPGMKEEKPQVRAAKAKLEQSVKELAEATKKVDGELQAAKTKRPKSMLENCMSFSVRGPEAREAFCQMLPPRMDDRLKHECWKAVRESAQYWENTCRAILGR
ncbi:MAG TPA: hypothetical protein VFA20_31310 [Myxococcaceae bacterium]|nr:hypothetical protein [Myxococcaceae bacterium]